MAESELSEPPFEAKAIANLILDWANRDRIGITPMKLQKLVYFSHADHLAITGKPLVIQDFEAWDYGPVIPSLIEEFREFSKSYISRKATQFDPISCTRSEIQCVVEGEALRILNALYEFYKHASATLLSEISHERNGPWDRARKLFLQGRNMDRRMTAEIILRFHRIERLS